MQINHLCRDEKLVCQIWQNYGSFETQTATNFDAKERLQYESAIGFQSRFSSDSRKFEEMDVNPFEQEGLVTISNVSVVYDHKIYNVLVLVNH